MNGSKRANSGKKEDNGLTVCQQVGQKRWCTSSHIYDKEANLCPLV